MPTLLRHAAADLRLAARALRRSRGHTLATVLLLALGVGATTAVFSAVHGVLLRPLPYDHGARMVHVTQPLAARAVDDAGFSATEVALLRAGARTLDRVVEYHAMSFTLLSDGEPAYVETGVVSADFFDVLGVRPLLGRTFRPGEDEAGAAPVLVLGHEFWMRRMGGDPDVVGRQVEMTDRLHTIVGVLPPFPQYPGENDVYMPVSSCPFRMTEGARTQLGARMLQAIGRTRPGATPEQARAELEAVLRPVRDANADAYPPESRFGLAVTPVRDRLAGDAGPTLALLAATALLVLLVTMANVANLHVVRYLQREHELAVRAALGATRGRLLRAALVEHALLGLLGGAAGLLVAAAGTRVLAALAGRFTARAAEIALDGPALLFALALALATSVAAGHLPLRAPSARLDATLRARGGSAARRPGRVRLAGALVVAQVALSVVLLVSAGLMVRTLQRLHAVDAGFDAAQVVTMRVTGSRDRYDTPELREQLNERLLERAHRVPGVVAAAIAGAVPLAEGSPQRRPLLLEGQRPGPATVGQEAEVRLVSGGYFQAIGAPLLRGTPFGPEQRRGTPPVAILSRALAERLFAGRDPLGRRVSLNGGETWAEVVGIAPDVKDRALDAAAPEIVYVNAGQVAPLGVMLLARTTGDPAGAGRALRAAVRELDPQLPVDRVATLAAVRDESLAATRVTTLLLGGFGLVALAIAMIGTGAVLAFQVGQRRREIGVRLAIGARRQEIVAMVLRQGLALTLAGVLAGLAVSLGLGRVMARFVFGIAPHDPPTLVGVALLLLLAAAAACAAPARRAAGVDPLVAMRADG